VKPTADGYIRVSRRAGREGESFISPEVQRKKIADWAKLQEVEVLQWWEEIDQSGANRERPMFQEALARCERHETSGIIVARLDRFARSAVDALESIKRLNQAGARLVSVEDNFDGSTPMGRFAIGILTLIAELELERIRESWDQAIRAAVARGVHISGRTPIGYTRDNDGRLNPIEPAASAVREVFRSRALGASWAELARYLEDQNVYPSTGNKHWSLYGVASLVKNPVYLGQARSGQIVNDNAHEPVVSRAEWDAAQTTAKSLFAPRDGSVASQAMLGGIARCAACGHTLKITGNTDRKTGTRYPYYYCIGRYATGPCRARANIRASYLDDYVEERILAALQAQGGLIAQAAAASEALEAAARSLAEAEHELDLYVKNPKILTLLGETKFLEGAETRQTAVDQAHTELAQLRQQQSLASELADGDLLKAWPTLTTHEKRRIMHGLLDHVLLQRGTTRGPNAEPTADRTQIILRGGTTLDPETKATDATNASTPANL
jgi:DNA invertase Pin-like site-specific DNA recombinase